MDMLTLAMAKAYTNSQRLGYIEKDIISWNGDTTGKPELGEDIFRISDKTFAADQVEAVILTGADGSFSRVTTDGCTMTHPDGTVETSDVMKLEVIEETTGFVVLGWNGTQVIFAASVSVDLEGNDASVEKGTYFAANVVGLENTYVSAVELKETIHPIDPKFLPGVCLPVVELSTTVANKATFTDAENAALSEAFNTKLPFVVHTNLSIGDIAVKDAVAVSQCGTMEGIGMIALVFGTTVLQLVERDGAWVVT